MPFETELPSVQGSGAALRLDPTSVVATVAGDTLVLAALGAGTQRRLFRIYLSNNGAAVVDVRLQETAAAVDFVTASLAALGGGVILDFGEGWTLADNVGLDVNLPAGGPFDVFVNVLEHTSVPT